jgi:hypothetical protein
VYLGAACLPLLNVIENQTIVGRLRRLLSEEYDGAFMAHWRLQNNKGIRHSLALAAAIHNIYFVP